MSQSVDPPAVRCAAAFGAGACFGAYALHRVRRAREGRTRPALEAAPDYRRRSSWYSHFELGAGREERGAPAGYQDGQDRADAHEDLSVRHLWRWRPRLLGTGFRFRKTRTPR